MGASLPQRLGFAFVDLDARFAATEGNITQYLRAHGYAAYATWNVGHQAQKPKGVALAEVKDDLSKYLRLAAEEEIIVTRHGRPAGVLIGFSSEEAWFECRLTHHPEFLRRIRAGHGIPLREVE